jgi:hypothetical protein
LHVGGLRLGGGPPERQAAEQGVWRRRQLRKIPTSEGVHFAKTMSTQKKPNGNRCQLCPKSIAKTNSPAVHSEKSQRGPVSTTESLDVSQREPVSTARSVQPSFPHRPSLSLNRGLPGLYTPSRLRSQTTSTQPEPQRTPAAQPSSGTNPDAWDRPSLQRATTTAPSIYSRPSGPRCPCAFPSSGNGCDLCALR